MPKSAKPKIDGYPDAPLIAASETSESISVSNRKRKQAQEPLYIDRV